MTINIRDIRGLPAAIRAMLLGDEEAMNRALASDGDDEPETTGEEPAE